MIICLTGFMGSGKSSVGRRLSELLCCPFMDLDSVIEDKSGRTIPEIFAMDGEKAFRQMEMNALGSILSAASHDSTAVVALGGGTLMTPECAELVHEQTLCIYLKATVNTLISHLEGESSGRPMLSTCDLRTRIEELMDIRATIYEKTAHIIMDTDGLAIEDICSKIREII